MALVRQAWRLVLMAAVYAAALLGAAGTWRWPAAWVFLALTVAMTAAYVLAVARFHPDLARERVAPPPDAKPWDRPFVALIGVVGPLTVAAVAGLDHRLAWSPHVPDPVQALALAAVAAAGAFTCWAVAVNPFFSAVVRIQRDRGHVVVSGGPYALVRHPGYAASLLHMAATPVALGALWAWVPVVLLVALTVVRTSREDRTLREELDGYLAYATRVRYRLLPGVW